MTPKNATGASALTPAPVSTMTWPRERTQSQPASGLSPRDRDASSQGRLPMDLREFPHTGNGNGHLPPVSPTTYARDWSAYNESQTQEKALFTLLLHGLCESLPALPQEAGRPRLRLSGPDMVFAATYKSCIRLFSGRRFMTDLREACASGYISRAAAPSTASSTTLSFPNSTPILHELITESALPLKTIETDFAIDSSGFTTSVFCGLWRSEKYGKDKQKIVHNWLKAHVMSGVRTNVVTSSRKLPRATDRIRRSLRRCSRIQFANFDSAARARGQGVFLSLQSRTGGEFGCDPVHSVSKRLLESGKPITDLESGCSISTACIRRNFMRRTTSAATQNRRSAPSSESSEISSARKRPSLR